jgi:hypothetical protein
VCPEVIYGQARPATGEVTRPPKPERGQFRAHAKERYAGRKNNRRAAALCSNAVFVAIVTIIAPELEAGAAGILASLGHWPKKKRRECEGQQRFRASITRG